MHLYWKPCKSCVHGLDTGLLPSTSSSPKLSPVFSFPD